MKLKKALKKAEAMGMRYVAVDKGGNLFAYYHRPFIDYEFSEWLIQSEEYPGVDWEDVSHSYLGTYTGKLNWNDTLREVGW